MARRREQQGGQLARSASPPANITMVENEGAAPAPAMMEEAADTQDA